MMFKLSSRVIASTALLSVCRAFTIHQTNDAVTLANAIFGEGITIVNSVYTGASFAAGVLTDGPFGMGTAAILTTGSTDGAATTNGDRYVNNGAPGSSMYCGENTFNGALLKAQIFVDTGFDGIRVELVIASEEQGGSADPVGIFVNDRNYAIGADGNRLSASSPYVLPPLNIVPPNSLTGYPGSSPPLWIDIPLEPGVYDMVIAVCDKGDSEWDSGLLIKAEGCIDCNNPIRLAYVTTTTTVGPGETPFTSTVTASGTVSGTIRIGVTADETTSSAEPTTTTTTEDSSTTTEDNATTTQEATVTTAEGTTTATAVGDTTTATATQDTTAITTNQEITTTIITTETATTSQETTITVEDITSGTTIEETMSGTDTTLDPDTTTAPTTEASTEASSSVTVTEELPASVATTYSTTTETSAATAESLSLSTESIDASTSDITTAAQVIPSDSTTGTEALSTSDVASGSTVTSSADVEATSISSTSQTIPTTTDESTPSLSSDISSEFVTTTHGEEATTVLLSTVFITTNTAQGPSSESLAESSAASAAVTSLVITSDQASASGLTTKSTGFPTGNSTVSHYPSSSSLLEPIDASSIQTSIDSVETLDSSVPPTKSSSGSIPPYPTTVPYDISKSTMTGVVAPIVTTLVYTIVDPNNPSSLTVTEFCTTLRSLPCRHCQYQKLPAVEMTTTEVECNACGQHGENTIILDVPVGAIAASHTKDHPAQKTDRVLYHEPKPHVQGDAPGQKMHPDEGESHAGHKPQELSPDAGSQSHEGDDHKVDWPQTHNARPTAVGNTHEQSNSAAETSPVLLAEETKPAHKFAPSAGLDHPPSQRPTYYHRHGPVPTPIMPGSSPDASVAIMSGAAFKTMDGLLVTIVVTGFVFLL